REPVTMPERRDLFPSGRRRYGRLGDSLHDSFLPPGTYTTIRGRGPGFKERLRLPLIHPLEPLRKPAPDTPHPLPPPFALPPRLPRISALPLPLPQPAHAHRRPQLPRLRFLAPGDLDRSVEGSLRVRFVRWDDGTQQLAPNAVDLGLIEALFATFHHCQRFFH